MDSRNFQKYLSRIKRQDDIEPAPGRRFHHAVVIPALAESDSLPCTLAALAAGNPPELNEPMVLVVINNSTETPVNKIQDNQLMLSKLRGGDRTFCGGLVPGGTLFWMDASSPGREISRKGGVGEARRLGMDAALPHLDFAEVPVPPLIFCLDADTLVEPAYLSSAVEFFLRHPGLAGAVFRFRHQDSTDPAESAAIAEYELFMRYFVIALRVAGSPYAYYSLGSATVCAAEAYVRAGGMRERNGGEDFYFMQALRKTGGIGQINASCVFPSSRPSDRVPFGTGPRIRDIMQGKSLKFYNPSIFFELKKLYAAIGVIDSPHDFSRLPALVAEVLAPDAALFFKNNAFDQAWPAMFRHNRASSERLAQAFNTWFDAFATLKFIHFCENHFPQFQRMNISDAFRMLFEHAGIAFPAGIFDDMRALLEFLRTADERFPDLLLS
ncbi:MAG: glycosyltransferase family 2 protein [Victivallaceae bacterium]|jgi:hypothetical protein